MLHLLFLLSLPLFVWGQTPAMEDNVWLPDYLLNPEMEMSALCIHGSDLLLIPQYPDKHDYRIYRLDTTTANNTRKSIQSPAPAQALYYTLSGLDEIKKQIAAKGEIYEGIEAATTDNANHIFLSIETSADAQNCYLVKGYINRKQDLIVLGNLNPLPRPLKIKNAGFEAIAYMPDKKKLIAFYEYNRDSATAFAYIINADNCIIERRVQFEKPLYLRLTDITYTGHGTFAGINYYYHGDGTTYLSTPEHYAIAEKIIGRDPKTTNYASIIQLSLSGNHITHRPLKSISHANDNWEGIARFGKGYFMIIDGKPPGKPCRLSWFPD